MTNDTRDADLSGILPALKDWSFSRFITISLVRFMYVLGLVLLTLGFVIAIFTGFAQGFGSGLIYIIGSAIGFALGVLWLRVSLEMVVVVFRIADNTSVLAKHARGEPLGKGGGEN